MVQEWIADARIRIEQARLLVLKTAWMIDKLGVKAARTEVAAIKVLAPALLTDIADRAIQLFGAAGFTGDFPLARFYSRVGGFRSQTGPTRCIAGRSQEPNWVDSAREPCPSPFRSTEPSGGYLVD